MTEIRPLMVPDNDGTDNEHQVYFITSIDSIPKLPDWMKSVDSKIEKLTKDSIDAQSAAQLVTKNDLDNYDFVSKEDLIKYAKKSDLNIYVTKDDLVNYATKTDMQNILDKAKSYTDSVVPNFNLNGILKDQDDADKIIDPGIYLKDNKTTVTHLPTGVDKATAGLLVVLKNKAGVQQIWINVTKPTQYNNKRNNFYADKFTDWN